MTARPLPQRLPDLTAAEAAALLGVSTHQVNLLCKLGKIRAYSVGAGSKRARWRITKEALTEFRAVSGVDHEAAKDPAPRDLPDADGREGRVRARATVRAELGRAVAREGAGTSRDGRVSRRARGPAPRAHRVPPRGLGRAEVDASAGCSRPMLDEEKQGLFSSPLDTHRPKRVHKRGTGEGEPPWKSETSRPRCEPLRTGSMRCSSCSERASTIIHNAIVARCWSLLKWSGHARLVLDDDGYERTRAAEVVLERVRDAVAEVSP